MLFWAPLIFNVEQKQSKLLKILNQGSHTGLEQYVDE